MGKIMSSIEQKIVKISISLPNELVRYIDERVENRSQLIESLLAAWQKKQQQQATIFACLTLGSREGEIESRKWYPHLCCSVVVTYITLFQDGY
jgi:Arc/MetJ-type ribon-helix-helix transcriptional regulator